MNAFSCVQTCGRLSDDPIHYTPEELDLMELERREAKRIAGDAEC